MGEDAIYDGFSYVGNGLVLTNIDDKTLARVENQVESLANRDGNLLVQSRRGSKPIFLEGYYDGDTPHDAEVMYDTLVQAHNRQERILKLPHAGTYREYTATPENIVIKQPDGLNRLTFSIDFIVPSGSANDPLSSTLFNEIITTPSASIPISVAGSVPARPLITLTFNSVVGGTGKTVSLRNARDFVGLTFERNFATNDVITIDAENFRIYINGVLTVPNGRIPSWAPGSGSVYYSDTFTSRTVNVKGTYNQRNL